MWALRSATPILLGGVCSWSMCPGGLSRGPEGPQHIRTALGVPSSWCAAPNCCLFGPPDSLLGPLSGVLSLPRSLEEETLPSRLHEAGI